jgi:hypothetical protein
MVDLNHPLLPAAAQAEFEQAAAAAASVQPAELAEGFARKDANEVLVRDGAQVLVAYLEAAQPLPIRGLFTFMDFWPQVGGRLRDIISLYI